MPEMIDDKADLPEQRARAVSYFVTAYLGVTPLGSLLIGWLAEYLRP